jgi:hypothetical protein
VDEYKVLAMFDVTCKGEREVVENLDGAWVCHMKRNLIAGTC